MGANRAVARGLGPQRQPEDLDEPDRGRVVERVARVVGGQVLLVQRERGAATGHDGAAVIEANPDLTRDHPLRARDIPAKVTVQGAEPQAVVGELGQLIRHAAVEAKGVLAERQGLQPAVRGLEDGGGRRLVDLAALDPDQAVLDVVDPPDPVGSGERVEALHERDRLQSLAVQADGDAALEANHDVHRGGCVDGRHGPGIGVRRRGGPRVLQDAGLARAAPDVDVDGVGAGLRDGKLDPAGRGVVDRLLAREAHADPHRCHHLEGRVQCVDRHVEADLVVALAGAPVGDRVGALLLGDLHEQLRDERPRKRRRQRVDALVARVGLQGRPAEVAHERLARVHHVGPRGPRRDRARLDALPQGAAADVDRERDHLRAELLAQPGDRDRGIETARVREDYLLHLRVASTVGPFGAGATDTCWPGRPRARRRQPVR